MATLALPNDAIAAPASLLDREFAPERVRLPSGAQVAVRRCGRPASEEAMVLLHGISSGAGSWLDVASHLGHEHHVIAWDMPGYGDSTPLDANAPSASDYAERLRETLDVLRIDRCILIGQSLGALIASAYAQRDPDRVAGLVLISPAQGHGQDAAAGERVRRERLGALRASGIAGLAAGVGRRLLSARASAQAHEWVRWNAERMTDKGYAQAVEMLAAGTLTAPPSRIPVQVLVGDDDAVTPPAACERAARALGAAFRTFPGAGHASPVEQPRVVADLIGAAARPMWRTFHA